VNQDKRKQSPLLPIAQWLLRRAMWDLGVEYEEMVEEVAARWSAKQDGACDDRAEVDVGSNELGEGEVSVSGDLEGWEDWSDDEGVGGVGL
jgi:hypothetical protein